MQDLLWDQIGNYQLVREIGRGSFGIVYLANQISLDREIALKIMPADLFPDTKIIERFQIEAIAAAHLRHPNIITIHEAGYDDNNNVYFFSMDYVNGPSLAHVIAEKKGIPLDSDLADSHFMESMHAVIHGRILPSSPEPDEQAPPLSEAECYEAVKKYLGITHAVSYAHEMDVLHQDIKPSNMVFDEKGRLCLLDFGTGEIQSMRHKTMQSDYDIATPLYASPEQLSSSFSSPGYQSDIYSLGVTLYEWLTLQLPFEADSYEELKERVLTKTPRSPHQINPDIPAPLSAIIMKAINRNLKERYQTVKAFTEDLEHFLNREPTLAENPGLWRRVSLWHIRNRRYARALYAIATLLVVSGILAFYIFFIMPRSPFKEAKRRMDEGYYELAIEELDKITETDADFEAAMILKADALNKREMPKELLSHCEYLIEHHGDIFTKPKVYIFKAKALNDLKRFDEAKTALQTAILQSDTPKIKALTIYELAKFLDELGHSKKDPAILDEAKAQYQEALDCDETLGKAHYALGLLLLEKKQYAAAEKSILEAIGIKLSEKPKYYAGLGDLYFAWQKPVQAKDAYDQAIKLDKGKNIGEYQLKKGYVLLSEKKYIEAVAVLRESYENDSEPGTLFQLARAYLLNGDAKKARSCAQDLFKEESVVYAARIWALLEDDDTFKILKQLLKSKALKTVSPDAFPKDIQDMLKSLEPSSE